MPLFHAMTLAEFLAYRQRHPPEGKVYFEDLSEGKQVALRELYKTQIGKLEEHPYPLRGCFADEEVVILGLAKSFPPYDDPVYRGGAPGQMVIRRADGSTALAFAESLCTASGWLVKPIPLRRPVPHPIFGGIPFWIELEHERHVRKAIAEGRDAEIHPENLRYLT